MLAVAICSALVRHETWSSLPFPWCPNNTPTLLRPLSQTHTPSVPYTAVKWDGVMNGRHRVTSILDCHINLSWAVNNSLDRGQTGTSHADINLNQSASNFGLNQGFQTSVLKGHCIAQFCVLCLLTLLIQPAWTDCGVLEKKTNLCCVVTLEALSLTWLQFTLDT